MRLRLSPGENGGLAACEMLHLNAPFFMVADPVSMSVRWEHRGPQGTLRTAVI